jgi:hypothetical protein
MVSLPYNAGSRFLPEIASEPSLASDGSTHVETGEAGKVCLRPPFLTHQRNDSSSWFLKHRRRHTVETVIDIWACTLVILLETHIQNCFRQDCERGPTLMFPGLAPSNPEPRHQGRVLDDIRSSSHVLVFNIMMLRSCLFQVSLFLSFFLFFLLSFSSRCRTM